VLGAKVHCPLPTSTGPTRGRLRKGLMFWLALNCALVSRWVEYGFPLQFVGRTPDPYSQPNHASALRNADFVDSAVAELLATSAACAWPGPELPICVSPLGVVPKAGGKFRLILDLRYVNRHLRVPKFQYEGLESAADVLPREAWMATLDLKAGYHHVDMAPEALPYLAFEWRGTTYTFLCLPFGLATAPWAFTKITRLLVRRWRSKGVACLGYIDDFLIASPSPSETAEILQSIVLPDLQAAGLQLSVEKCHFCPSQAVGFLGTTIDCAAGVFRVPKPKSDALLGRVASLLANAGACPARDLAKVTGALQSMRWAFGIFVPLFTRECYNCLTQVALWDSCTLPEACVSELQFWADNFETFNGYARIWRTAHPVHTIHSDAAGMGGDGYQGGWGGTLRSPGQPTLQAAGAFAGRACEEHSTFQELTAIYNNLCTFLSSVRGRAVEILCDNQAACAILSAARSRSPPLHDLCKAIWLLCVRSEVVLSLTWIPRELNVTADGLSKFHDRGDWVFAWDAFQALSARWGPFTFDLFAAAHNCRTPRFFSWLACPDAAGVNAFSHSWAALGLCWCFPPYPLITRALDRLLAERVKACLVVPALPGACYWPRLVRPGHSHLFAAFVHDCVFYPHRVHQPCISPGLSNRPGAAPVAWDFLALLVDPSPSISKCIRLPHM
jgi:hypothetical protein